VKKYPVSVSALRILLCAFVISIIGGFAPTKSFAGSVPITKNMGQWPDSILFRASADGATMWFTKNGIWYQFFKTVEKATPSASAIDPSALWAADVPSAPYPVGSKFSHDNDSILTTMVKAEFVGASSSVEVLGFEEMEYKCNYFIGNDKSQWRSNVPNYTAVTMKGLYPGVDVSFSSRDGRLSEELVASSSEALAQVKVEYRGALSVNPLTSFSTIVQTSLGEHQFEGIMLADQPATKMEKPIASSASTSENAVSLVYSTYLGADGGDFGHAIAFDGARSTCIIGSTLSMSFPILDPVQGTLNNSSFDVFVTKINSAGNGLIYSTYLGGHEWDAGEAIAVDSGGSAFVTGWSGSHNFPIVNGIVEGEGSPGNAFVTKLNSSGNAMIYSTYLGGDANDWGNAIAVDSAGNAYVTGSTASTDFPILNPIQAIKGVVGDIFVTKLNSAGTGFIYSTFLGGDNNEEAYGIDLDASGNAYITGSTTSTDFPLMNALQDSNWSGSLYDGFVAKINSSGSGLIYSTYFGGDGYDAGLSIVADAEGNAYFTGQTSSSNLVSQSPLQASPGGYEDAFVSKINSDGTVLVFSTYLGGSGHDFGRAIALDNKGNACITGQTGSADFVTKDGLQNMSGGSYDAFVTKLDSAGNTVIFSTLLGGTGDEDCFGIAIDPEDNIYLTGRTNSTNFPTRDPFQSLNASSNDAFVTKLDFGPCCTGSRGNVDRDALEVVNVTDITFLVQYLFQGGAEPSCIDEANVAVSSSLNIVDLTVLVNYLMAGGPPPPSCP
jgi:Beta-propeller repeat